MNRRVKAVLQYAMFAALCMGVLWLIVTGVAHLANKLDVLATPAVR